MTSKINSKYIQTLKSDESFLTCQWFLRPLSFPLVLLFNKLNISANTITILAGLVWISSIPLLILSGQYINHPSAKPLMIAASLCWMLGFLLDVVDGGLARLRGEITTTGAYLDLLFHHIFNPMFFCSIGIFLFLTNNQIMYLFLGILSICTNWGVTQATKKWILCAKLAKGQLSLPKLTQEERWELLHDATCISTAIDNIKVKGQIINKLINEIIWPGQFFILGISLISCILIPCFRENYILFKLSFVAYSVLLGISLPVRIYREFKTLDKFEPYFNN